MTPPAAMSLRRVIRDGDGWSVSLSATGIPPCKLVRTYAVRDGTPGPSDGQGATRISLNLGSRIPADAVARVRQPVRVRGVLTPVPEGAGRGRRPALAPWVPFDVRQPPLAALEPGAADGVLPSQDILALLEAGIINAGEYSVPPENIQPASLDLRLGARRLPHPLQLPARPRARRGQDEGLVIDELDLHDNGAVLETNRPYLVPLKERLALPKGIRGNANPKSSTGRVDVFTRLITDRGAASTRWRRATRDRSTSRWCRSRSRCGSARTSRSTSCACRSAAPCSPTARSAPAGGPAAALPRRGPVPLESLLSPTGCS